MMASRSWGDKFCGGMSAPGLSDGAFMIQRRSAAELRALAPVLAGRIGAESDAIGASLDEIALSAQPRHPKTVDHVRRGHFDLNRGPDRKMQLVVRADVQGRIAVLPPPLMTD